jgi:PAS domain S-box-containing protein
MRAITIEADRPDDEASVRDQLVAILGEAAFNCGLAIFVADEDMRYIAANDSACRLVGYDRDELLAMRVTDVAIAPGSDDLYTEMMQSGQAFGTTPLRTRDGSVILFSYWAAETVARGRAFYMSVGVRGKPRNMV